jgi:hypothetical protein
MKSLSINEYEAEVIPSAVLIRMLVKEAEKKSITVTEVPHGEGRGMKFVGKWLLIVSTLFFGIHLLAWWVRP